MRDVPRMSSPLPEIRNSIRKKDKETRTVYKSECETVIEILAFCGKLCYNAVVFRCNFYIKTLILKNFDYISGEEQNDKSRLSYL